MVTSAHQQQQANRKHGSEKTGRWLGTALHDFPWVHLGIGLAGNATFFIGSLMFFSQHLKTVALWMFAVGSLGMLVGSLGELFVRIEKRREGKD